MTARAILTALVATALMAAPAHATAPEPPDPAPVELDVTPPRLGAVWGSASFWRPGEEGWSAAEVNTPLAPGDELATGADGTIEVQIGRGAFLRVRPNSRMALDDQQSGAMAFRLETGEASLDLRELPPDQDIELQVPGAALASPSRGLYRVRAGSTAAFTARRGGRAFVTVPEVAAHTPRLPLHDGEEITVAAGAPRRSAAAPAEDAWDRWNDARTASLVDAVSAPHVSPQVSGAHDLDRHGRWTSTAEYGAVWVPGSVPDGWAPYSTGRWLWDPRFGWTWIDEASWGWLPYHYGRWVVVDGAWAWTPGPRVVRVHYSPALVAFFGGPAVQRPIGWVALGWGEPVVPWWGPSSFASRPWWGGWAGPRVVNNVVVHRTTVVNVTQVNVYRNTSVRNAVVVVPHDRFGRDHVRAHRIAHAGPDVSRSPIRGRLPVEPDRVSPRDRREPGARDARPALDPRPGRDRDSVRDDEPGPRTSRDDDTRRRAEPAAARRDRDDATRDATPAPRRPPAPAQRIGERDRDDATRPTTAPRARREPPIASPRLADDAAPRARDGNAEGRTRAERPRAAGPGPSAAAAPRAGARSAAPNGDVRLQPSAGKPTRDAVTPGRETRPAARAARNAPDRARTPERGVR